MQERIALIAADRWVEDDQGERVFQVDEMAMAKLNAFILRDPHGVEVAKLRHADLEREDEAMLVAAAVAIEAMHIG